MTAANEQRYLVFISHSHADSWVAKQIAKNLEAAGVETFLDQLHIAAGEDFEARIIAALYQADELLVLFTPWGQASKFVWMEIGAAWYKKIPIVPVLYGLTINDVITPVEFPIVLKKRDMITLNQIDDYFEQLKKKLSTTNQ